MPGRCITLTTDFGARDSYVGQMKGAIASICPTAVAIDLCHEVPAHDVAAGAYVLETGYAAFPDGTIHVVVVDPGVGGERRAIVVQTRNALFLAPDNGVLSRVLDRERIRGIHVLDNPEFRGPRRSATFEGRDVFAPAAAWLASGVAPSRLGAKLEDLRRLRPAGTVLSKGKPVSVPVVHVDHFGNVVFDVHAKELERVLGHPAAPGDRVELVTPRQRVERLVPTYESEPGNEPFLLINSAGYLEAAVRCGRAAERLDLRGGALVELTVGVDAPRAQ